MMAFFNLGLIELAILGIFALGGLGAVIAVCIAMAGSKKNDEED
jgi:hypothetical protein